MNFKYGKKEMEYLKSQDRRLGEVIDQIGRIRWTVEPDLFSAIVQNIVSQPQDADGLSPPKDHQDAFREMPSPPFALRQRCKPLLLDGRRRRHPRPHRPGWWRNAEMNVKPWRTCLNGQWRCNYEESHC